MFAQADAFYEVEVGTQYLCGSVIGEHTYQQGHYALDDERIALGLEVQQPVHHIGLQPHTTLAAVYQAQSGGQPVGYAINVEASGSQGTISMMVGIDMDGAVTGVSIVTNSETSGIGSKVMSNEPLTNGTRVLDQFIGKSAADGVLSVGSNVDAITGATVSTKGVTTGVNAALAAAGVIG